MTGGKWIIQEMKQHVPAVRTDAQAEIRAPNPVKEDVGLWDLFVKNVADKEVQASCTIAVEKECGRYFDNRSCKEMKIR